jgi:hypothetical protein
MSTVFLAFVLFTSTEAPKIVGGFKTLDACLVVAGKLNKDADRPWVKEITGGYVCLQMRAPV